MRLTGDASTCSDGLTSLLGCGSVVRDSVSYLTLPTTPCYTPSLTVYVTVPNNTAVFALDQLSPGLSPGTYVLCYAVAGDANGFQMVGWQNITLDSMYGLFWPYSRYSLFERVSFLLLDNLAFFFAVTAIPEFYLLQMLFPNSWSCLSEYGWFLGNDPCLYNWNGIGCQNHTVVSIDLSAMSYSLRCPGTVNWTSLPPSLQVLRLPSLQFSGTVYWPSLPSSLRVLDLARNDFSGTIDLSMLPQLEYVDLQENNFSGAVRPPPIASAVLTTLYLNSNMLSGTFPWLQLPKTLQTLQIYQNNFSGTVSFDRLSSIRFLSLGENAFTGTMNLALLPAELQILNVSYNSLTGSLQLQSLTMFNASYITVIDCSHNQFEGSVDLIANKLSGRLKQSIEWHSRLYTIGIVVYLTEHFQQCLHWKS